MNRPDSTVCNADGSTVREEPRRRAAESGRTVAETWEATGNADLPAALCNHPEILADRSVFFDLAQKEFRLHRSRWADRPAGDYCERFSGVDVGLLRSLHRLIEVEQCLGNVDLQQLLSTDDEASWPVAGGSYGEFRVIEEIGRGSAGRVYRCYQEALGDREVVVKVSSAVSGEAAALGRLRHPNVVQVYSGGVDTATGLGWICMPYLGSNTLLDVIENRASTKDPGHCHSSDSPHAADSDCDYEAHESSVLGLFADLANGLEYLHSRSVLHGDLKPSNILLTDEGKPVLIDFNLSHRMSGETTVFGGTLPYMAPELLVSCSNESVPFSPSVATDVFAFGVTLHEALTGKSPFGEQTYNKSLQEVATSLLSAQQSWRQSWPSGFSTADRAIACFLRRCMAESPGERPSGFAEIEETLRRLCSPSSRFQRSILRRPRLVAVALAASLVIASVVAWASPRAYYSRVLKQAERFAAEGQHDEAIDKTRAYVAAFPGDPEATELLTTGLLATRDYEGAAAECMRAWRRRGDPLSLVRIGYCRNLQGQYLHAIGYYNEAIKHGHRSSACDHNLAASRLIALSQSYSPVISREIERLLDRAWKNRPGEETIRLTMLRHYLLSIRTRPSEAPDYPIAIAAFPNDKPGTEFCRNAARFVAIRTSNQRELSRLGMPCLRRLANLEGAERARFDLGEELLASYRQLLDEKPLLVERETAPPPPPSYLDPAVF